MKIEDARVLMIATNGFAELFEPRRILAEAGARVTLASVERRPIQGLLFDDVTGSMSERSILPELALEDVDTSKFDALVLPGGVRNPDTLRMNPEAVRIVRRFSDDGKVVAAICHAPWMLIEAGVVSGRRVTGWFSIRTDLRNAGGEVVDEPVVVDRNIITSRMPSDIPAFSSAVIEALTRTKASPKT